ncbi:MAG: DUF934 domain-containing protein [Gammaproteobacteria bacterium]
MATKLLLTLGNGQLNDTLWHEEDGAEAQQPNDHLLLNPDRFRQQIEQGGTAVVGLLITSDTDLEAVSDLVKRATTVALHFPTFTDGRCFSHAKRLRSQYGYRNTLIATGYFLPDQVSFLKRCGIDQALFDNQERATQACRMTQPFARPYQVSLNIESKS